MWHDVHTGIAHPSKNHPDLPHPPSPPSIQTIAFFKCGGVCLRITDVHGFLLFSIRSVLSTELAMAKGLVGDTQMGRGALLSRQSRQFFKLAFLNFKHGGTVSVGHLTLSGLEGSCCFLSPSLFFFLLSWVE